jgi:hypothetical protein
MSVSHPSLEDRDRDHEHEHEYERGNSGLVGNLGVRWCAEVSAIMPATGDRVRDVVI